MTKHQLAGCTVGVALFACVGVLSAHEGHAHAVRGTVTMAAADHVMLKTTEGKDVTMTVTEKTKVTKGKVAIKIEDLTAGTRVVVTPVSEKEPLIAATIQVGVAAKPAAAKQ
jgi:hypothetical protein